MLSYAAIHKDFFCIHLFCEYRKIDIFPPDFLAIFQTSSSSSSSSSSTFWPPLRALDASAQL